MIPSIRGDTGFAGTVAAFEAPSPGMQALPRWTDNRRKRGQTR